jgi:methionyl-tRNA synthetase
MPETSKFYVTTPIYYVNARPHIGHAYTTIVADVLARRHRLQYPASNGGRTWFLTGTDEHGQKIERSAAAAGIAPQQFADEVSASFQSLWARMGITNDQYIRTTNEAHKRGAQKLFRELYDRGHIYLASYTGQYCVSEEMFVEGPPGTIGPDGKPTETVTEENFFFRLSDFQLPLLDLIESDTLELPARQR